jgi:hypothetical protein
VSSLGVLEAMLDFTILSLAHGKMKIHPPSSQNIVWLANCYFAHDSSGFVVLLRPLHCILKELE